MTLTNVQLYYVVCLEMPVLHALDCIDRFLERNLMYVSVVQGNFNHFRVSTLHERFENAAKYVTTRAIWRWIHFSISILQPFSCRFLRPLYLQPKLHAHS